MTPPTNELYRLTAGQRTTLALAEAYRIALVRLREGRVNVSRVIRYAGSNPEERAEILRQLLCDDEHVCIRPPGGLGLDGWRIELPDTPRRPLGVRNARGERLAWRRLYRSRHFWIARLADMTERRPNELDAAGLPSAGARTLVGLIETGCIDLAGEAFPRNDDYWLRFRLIGLDTIAAMHQLGWTSASTAAMFPGLPRRIRNILYECGFRSTRDVLAAMRNQRLTSAGIVVDGRLRKIRGYGPGVARELRRWAGVRGRGEGQGANGGGEEK